MKTEETTNFNKSGQAPVQRDSETPLAKKPSVLYIGSIVLGVITIITLVASAYHGVVGL
jgi:hypothetical protein